MSEDVMSGCNLHEPLTDKSAEKSTEEQNARPARSRQLLSSLFGQVAATTVRNIIDDGVATLEKLDSMLAERVAHFCERRKQLKTMQHEDERQHVLLLLETPPPDSRAPDCSVVPPQQLAAVHIEEDTSYKLHNEELKHLKDD